MGITYENVILACWVAFLTVWLVSAFNAKRDIRGSHGTVRRQFWYLAAIVLLFVALRVAKGTGRYTPGLIFSHGIFSPSPLLEWAAATLTIIGVCFAIWARAHLGRNWSSRPAVKEHHELVTTGPYAYVRHPIYTGLILMAFAVALTGTIVGAGVFVIASVVFSLRIGKEEEIMLNLFPDEYSTYQRRTKRLIPFVW